MGIDELKTELLKLDAAARALLARDLLASLEDLSAAELDALWADEALQRDRELDRGETRGRPFDEVLAQARARRA